MREIKFRCWSTSVERMYPHEHIMADSAIAKVVFPMSFDTSEKALAQQKHREQILIPMQFTGILDRNGKEIYEGDILKREYDFGVGTPHIELHVVVFQKGCFGEENDEGQFLPISVFDILPEVIGNVYQNPDRK